MAATLPLRSALGPPQIGVIAAYALTRPVIILSPQTSGSAMARLGSITIRVVFGFIRPD
jgi:hypothetical protein